jgi:hypothetical protein
MKKLLFTLALLLAAVPTFGQGTPVRPQPDCVIPFQFTAAGTGMEFNNKPRYDSTGQLVGGCVTWHFEYANNGFSVVSVEPQGADASGAAGIAGTYATWTPVAAGTTLPLTATTQGQATGYRYQPWVRVKATTLTGTGTLTGVLFGYRPLSGQDANSATGASYATDSSGRLIVAGPGADGATAANPFPVAMRESSTGFARYLECAIDNSVCVPKMYAAGYSAMTTTEGSGNAVASSRGTTGGAVFPAVNTLNASNSNGTLTTVQQLDDYVYPLTTSATNTAQTVIIDTRNLHDILATCTTSPLATDSIGPLATVTKFYVPSTVGATVALPPLAARWIRVVAGTAGVGNTTTLRMYAK